MAGLRPTLARQWDEMLSLSAVKPGERVVVLNRIGGSPAYRDVAIDAARAAGAEVAYLEAPSTDALPAAALAALERADLVIDLAFAHDPEVQRLLAGGARFLVVLEPPEILARMFPTPSRASRPPRPSSRPRRRFGRRRPPARTFAPNSANTGSSRNMVSPTNPATGTNGPGPSP